MSTSPVSRRRQGGSCGRLSMTAIGARIRDQRRAQRLSLEDLAARSEVSRSMLSAIELGAKVPTVLVMDRIAGALGVSVSRLLAPEESAESVVLLGRLEIVLDRSRTYVLGPGDALYYKSDVVHAFRNAGRATTVAYIGMLGRCEAVN